MSTFNLGDAVRFSPAVLQRTQGHAKDARGVVVGWAGPGVIRVDFAGTYTLSEKGSTIRAIPRRNIVRCR